MLSHDKLFKKDYNKIFEYSKHITDKVYTEWSDKELHDPGVTLLETFSFLKDLQQYYMEQTTEKTQKNLLKILGNDIKKGTPMKIEALVDNVEDQIIIANKEKMIINNHIYESLESKVLVQREVNKIAVTDHDNKTSIYEMPLKYENYFYPFGSACDENSSFSIGFLDRPSDKDKISLYIKGGNHLDIKRTRINNHDKHYPIALVKWQYLGIDNGEKKWIDATVIQDETYNLIQSGRIVLKTPFQKAVKEAYYNENDEPSYWIRGFLEDGYYDLPPKIEYITLNSIDMIQKNTIVDLKNIKLGMLLKSDSIISKDYLYLYGDIIIFIKHSNGWIKLERSKDTYTIDKDIKDMTVRILFHPDVLRYLQKYGVDEEVIKIVSFEKDKKGKLYLGSGTGFSNQVINLPYDDLVYDDVSILVGEEDDDGRIVYKQWKKTESIKSCDKYDRAYEIDIYSKDIVFGDGINGRVVPKLENNIILVSLSISNFNKAGIHQKHKLVKNLSNENKKILDTKYIEIVEKAQNIESTEDVMERCEREFLKPSRTVTQEDYHYFVKKVPGLKIKDISLFPGFSTNMKNNTLIPAHNSITIQVEPYADCSKKCIHYYRENIIRYLENYRLLTTDVSVCFPEYIGIDIYLDIILIQNNIYVNDNIKKSIQEVFRDCEAMGEITVENIYMSIMKLEEIQNINSIQLMISYGSGYRNKKGNIVIPMNGRVVINDIDIVFTKI